MYIYIYIVPPLNEAVSNSYCAKSGSARKN